jgi:NADPH2:quinone reductase
MRAFVYDTDGQDFGVLRPVELPDPVPGPGEVRVRVVVSGVNPTDWKARSVGPGTRAWSWQVPDQDGAGVIDAVGPGVDPSRVGDRVWLHLAAHGHAFGTAAEYVCVPSRRAVTLPDEVPFDIGAGLGVPALTAHRCLFADGDIAGRTVLVTGGGGAVGHAAVQLARHAGARVITTVSGDERAAIAATAGPDVVLHYRDADHAERLRESAPEGIDRVVDVDVAVNLASYAALLDEAAVVAVYAASEAEPDLTVPVRPLMRRNVLLRFVLLYGVTDHDLDAGAAHVTGLLGTVGLVPMPTVRFPLEQLEAAHAYVRSGAPGKVLVDVASP